MDSARETTVLFADVSGSTQLFESAGDAQALEAIQNCLERLRQAAQAAGGRVVKTIGDEIMALFAAPEAAADAAGAMQSAIDAMPPVANTKLGVRIGFHRGPVIQRDGDVFGDTVNLAARLAQQANKDQIITSGETAARLGPHYNPCLRPLYRVQVKGKSEEIELCEIVWRVGPNTDTFQRPTVRPVRIALRLKLGAREYVRRREGDSISIGRSEECGLVIADELASRNHCSIERRNDKFVLVDQSTNGTYVIFEDGTEVLLQREEFVLRRHGWLCFGQPRSSAVDVVEYFCE
jgi:class 3 adenylate cyclase